MATSRKGICTRGNLTPTPETVLCSAMEKFRQMRKEHALQQQRQEELVTTLRQRDEKFLQRKRIAQLSPSYNKIFHESESNVNMGNDVRDPPNFKELCYKLKPDIYDGSALLRELLTQFKLISHE